MDHDEAFDLWDADVRDTRSLRRLSFVMALQALAIVEERPATVDAVFDTAKRSYDYLRSQDS